MANYKDTLFLPKTTFSIKGNLPVTEVKILKKWQEMSLYNKMKDSNPSGSSFILHDGPPYANGNLHIGHALNKILKDATVRFQRAQGKKIEFVPGWDCHGLPIEWQVEKEYRKAKRNKNDDILQFRDDCRQYARKWVDIQKEQFQRFGVTADWDNPYLTMDFGFEATIVEQLLRLVEQDKVYSDERPVMWSPVEHTSLAEAEIEYKDIDSTSAYVLFPLKGRADEHVVVWTTTPWTLPSNEAVAVNPDLDYCLIDVGGPQYWLARDLVNLLMKKWGHDFWTVSSIMTGQKLVSQSATFRNGGIISPITRFRIPLLCADFVTADTGTGFVHIAPAHGEDDFKLGKSRELSTKSTVGPNGVYNDNVPVVGGQHVFKCDKIVLDYLSSEGLLKHTEVINHSYPHSWRSKKPIIYMTTPQWFVNLDEIKKSALISIDRVKWHPETGHNRIRSMIENRGDWCISRQRSWGVPLTLFVDKRNGSIKNDHAINTHILKIIKKEGCDAWFTKSVSELLPPGYDSKYFKKVTDVLDVWFDSGSTHAHVLDRPADLYLEGSDQHRGWFQSSLLLSIANKKESPYREVLTHGFVLDKNRKKMSKSEKNVVDPNDIINKHGADILRLWALSSNYTTDLTLGDDIIARNVDMYKRIRNTMRYLLSNLQEDEVTPVSKNDMPELEKYVLAKVAELDSRLRKYVNDYNYYSAVHELHEFCNNILSSFYFDIRKDCLYCDRTDNKKRLACLFVLDVLYRFLTGWFAPILPFTMEEVWSYRNYGTESIHLNWLLDVSAWKDTSLLTKWKDVKQVRDNVSSELEKSRADGLFGRSLDASIQITTQTNLNNIDLIDLFIVSEVTLQHGREQISVSLANGHKCDRCWQVKPTLVDGLCDRCQDAI